MTLPPMHWKEDAPYTEPLRTVVPDISVVEAISRHHLLTPTDISTGGLTVTFLGEGSFNKAYTIDIKSTSFERSYVFRATLPVEPCDKVRNEVASLDFIKQRTNIPVPAVVAYASSSENTLAFEWILMEKIAGEPLSNIWRSLSDTSKVAITREIASYVLQMRMNCVFHEIGGLYHDDNRGFTIGRIVTQFAFMGARRQLLSRDRGPYHHDSDFMRALIDIQIADIQLLNTLTPDDPKFDEDLFEDGPAILILMEELLSLVPVIFPEDENDKPFRTFLTHPDLSLNNIMIDPNTLNITGIIDWECTNASPQWEHPYPQFLIGPNVEKEPPRVEPGDTDPFRNDRWDDWEKMQLRAVFDEVVGPLVEEPTATLKREFLDALVFAELSERALSLWLQKAKRQLAVLGIRKYDTELLTPASEQSVQIPIVIP